MAPLTPTAHLPYLTADLPGVGGAVKQRPEDFRVEELPLYEPSGEGTHVYFRLTKTNLPTPEAVRRVARHLGVRPEQIGLAGLKDARAVTVQRMSVEHVDPARLAGLRDPKMTVEVLGRHTNKLRPGHLRGNRFAIRIRGVGPEQLPAARAVLDVLTRRGVPNYFGPQRFGARGDTAALGEALVRGDAGEFVALLLGRPAADDPPDCRAARDAFDNGLLDRALKCWPRHYVNERKALAAFKKRRRPVDALRPVEKRMKRLYVSAFQSAIFNEILAERIETLDRLFEGDLACKGYDGPVFPVLDAAAEQPRADRFEISPTGAVVGYRSSLASGEPGRIETAALRRHNVTPETFRHVGALKPKGTRRALRFAPADADISAGADEHGDFLLLTFTAPPGCYATALLREIIKPAAQPS